MTLLDQTVATLGDLISFPSVSSDSNIHVIGYLARRMEDMGARIEVMHDESGTKANLVATFGPEGDGGLMLCGHTDVVPVADQPWTHDPFEMVERDGLLYGRGTCDMKGFIAACVEAAPMLAEQVKNRPLHFVFTHDEEVGCLGAQALVALLKKRKMRPALAIIGEPTEMRVIEGHKGCYEYYTEFTGLEGHGSAPDRGVNAVEFASRYVARLLDLKDQLKARTPPGSRFDPPWTTINVGALTGGHAHNVIPARAEIAWEMRPVVTGDADFVKADLEAYVADVLLPAMRAVDPEAGIVTRTVAEVPGLEPMDTNAARDLCCTLTGANGTHIVPFGTEAGLFQSLGIDAVVCGPGSIQQAHMADEFISRAQLGLCLDMLTRLGARL
ncbi:acetylornithine deacetylase [Psychromarinibacter halotolerans]|uniref:Acetylornithine deacetylase n=1 Tax=Psychromarinibacter halotolerans TaxID=1775175 RepID=A0ABV7GTQ0_9RHOB|nr:acetylornithine deacetylase [Psychromarinibacter halotolerans]MDF0596634.1 acetylornithine deacetylase [Psychromarinibacter halotolerans]